jgi:quinol monooxygenase YgiN
MYGTVGHLQVKAGRLGDLTREIRALEGVAGVRAMALVGKEGSETSFAWTIVWESKAAHDANGERPEFPEIYARLLEILASEPEWHSGEITYMHP